MLKSVLIAMSLAALLPAAAPAQSLSPLPAGEPVVIGQSYLLASDILGQERRINVYIPDACGPSQKPCPVIYLLDGGINEDFHSITGIVQAGVPGMSLRPVIVVGIADIDRRHDLTAPSSDPRDLHDVPTQGGAEKFRAFIGRELQPWVQSHFRTSGERALMGESLAGLFVTETFLKAPDMFDTYIAISPSLWWDNMSLSRAAARAIKAQSASKRFLYLSIGDEGGDMKGGVDSLVTALKANPPAGLDWIYAPLPQEHHNTVYHPAALNALRWRFGVTENP